MRRGGGVREEVVMRQGYCNETGRALSLQGFFLLVLAGGFGILYFGGVSKFRNKYRTESIRAS